MNPKEKALNLFMQHLTAIAEETMDCDSIMKYNAKKCALVTASEIIANDPLFSESADLSLDCNHTQKYWENVKTEILNL